MFIHICSNSKTRSRGKRFFARRERIPNLVSITSICSLKLTTKGNHANIIIEMAEAKKPNNQALFCMREAPSDLVVVGGAIMVVGAGVAIIGVVFGVVVCFTVEPPPVFVFRGTPLPSVLVAALPLPRTFPASVQKLSRPVIMERLSDATDETNSAHVKTAPSKTSGNHAVLVGLALL
jgi:hypothetical protein